MLEPEAQCVPEFAFDRQRFLYLQESVKTLGTVSDNSTCAATATASGSGLERAKREEELFHHHCFAGELKSKSGEKIRVNVRDERNGSYVATYTIPSQLITQ